MYLFVISGDIFKDESLTNSEQLWLGVVLRKTLWNKYNMSKKESGQWTVQTLKESLLSGSNATRRNVTLFIQVAMCNK